MGVAAYNRGTQNLRRQIAAKDRHPDLVLMDDLNALPKHPEAQTPFGPVRLVHSRKVWWVECPDTGFGFHYKTLREAVRRWRITITESPAPGVWVAMPMPVAEG